MAVISADFAGELWADKKGELIVLRAGDTVPAGTDVEAKYLDDQPVKAGNKSSK